MNQVPDFHLLAYVFSQLRRPRLSTYWQIFNDLKNGTANFAWHVQLQAIGKVRIEEMKKGISQSLERGYILLYPGHPYYPDAFLNLDEIPYLMRMQGHPVWLQKPGLAIVGSREPHSFSLQWMNQELNRFLALGKCFSVSGAARGVDQKAHALSLLQKTPTVALLPSGLKAIYPSQFENWILPITEGGGALLSEYEDEQNMQKHHFLQRNRLISALAKATLIIEAKRRSGTLITAQQAIEQHRPVWVIPGHPLDARYQGSLDLIIEGATPLRNAEDLGLLFDSEIHAFSTPRQLEIHI